MSWLQNLITQPAPALKGPLLQHMLNGNAAIQATLGLPRNGSVAGTVMTCSWLRLRHVLSKLLDRKSLHALSFLLAFIVEG